MKITKGDFFIIVLIVALTSAGISLASWGIDQTKSIECDCKTKPVKNF